MRTKRRSCGCAACATTRTWSTSSDGLPPLRALSAPAGAPIMSAPPRIALTSGEPAGIGPDLCLALARDGLDCDLVCLADRALLAERAKQLELPIALLDYDSRVRAAHAADLLRVDHHPLAVRAAAGKLNRDNARYVLALLDRA